MSSDLTFTTLGSYGLRQYGGWVREEFAQQLVGRQAARVYREMLDNCATVSSVNFAITQTMRQVEWRVEPSDDSPECAASAEWVESLMDDMSHTWNDFISESLSMLPFGYSFHEIVYKRRLGHNPGNGEDGKPLPKSKFDDGKIGLRKLPIRGQETILKWFFDEDGGVQGVTQQPWVGPLLDIPIDKGLLFRPRVHKNNPEGYSILRGSYRPWWFLKRLEEQEAIMFERFSGFPVMTVPNSLIQAAAAGDANSAAALEQYKKIVRNIRIDEQMGLLIPSDTYVDADGKPSAVPMYDFKLVSPSQGRAAASADTSIERYKLDIMTSVLADFLSLGHSSSSRGTQTVGEAKIDLFFKAIEGWLESNADVLNNHLLPRLWDLNGFDFNTMPRFVPDMPQRVDLDGLSNFVLRLSQAGMPLFPDEPTQEYLREVAGLPDPMEGFGMEADALSQTTDTDATADGPVDANADLQKHIAGALAKRFIRKGWLTPAKPVKKRRRKRGS